MLGKEQDMRCLNCTAENTAGRRFCSECGNRIADFCSRCGFINYVSDKYCGGCALDLSLVPDPDVKPDGETPLYNEKNSRYSADEINELISHDARKKKLHEKKKEGKEIKEMSQDLIDSIFSSDKKDDKNQED